MNQTSTSSDADLITQLREYAANPGYSHGDYADTMRQAAARLATPALADVAADIPTLNTLTRWTFDGGMTAAQSESGQWVRYADLARLAALGATADVHGLNTTPFDVQKQSSFEHKVDTPVAWMNPNEGCVMDAFIWSRDAQSPRYSVPVYTCPASGATASTAPDATGFSEADWNKDTGTRLRRAARLAGLSDAVLPDDDTILFGCTFTVLGMIAGALEKNAASGATAETVKAELLIVNDAGIELAIERRADGKWQFLPTPTVRPQMRFPTSVGGDARSAGALHDALTLACKNLPAGCEIRVCVEHEAGWVEWSDSEGKTHHIEGEGFLSDDVTEAFDAARAAIAATPEAP